MSPITAHEAPRAKVETALTKQKELAKWEKHIAENLEASERHADAVMAGLLAIREASLWKMKLDSKDKPFLTFAAYYAECWEARIGHGLRRAYQLCVHEIVTQAYEQIVRNETPANEWESRRIAASVMQDVPTAPSNRLSRLKEELNGLSAEQLKAERDAIHEEVLDEEEQETAEEIETNRKMRGYALADKMERYAKGTVSPKDFGPIVKAWRKAVGKSKGV